MIRVSGQEERGRPNRQELDGLVRQVADSDTFRMAPVMQNLLLYLWEHQGQPIGEYAIATEALGRAPAFDQKSDSTVRVQVSRLRAKLNDFYQANGDSFPLRLELPRGKHELKWEYLPPRKSIASQLDGLPKSYLWGTASAGILLIIACVTLLIEVRQLKRLIPTPPVPMARLWRSFLTGNKPTVIVVPSPLYFNWPSRGVFVRDLRISDFDQWGSSPLIKHATEQWGPPQWAQLYVGAAEMSAGVDILQYLERAGQQVRLVESKRFSTAMAASQNIIYVGMSRNAGYFNPILAKTNYYMASTDPEIVRSRHPRPGEPEEYHETTYSSIRTTAPSIIVLLPPSPEHTRMLLFLGKYMTAATSIMLSHEGLKLVDEAWRKAGSPAAWEMLTETEFNADVILKFTVVSCRSIPASFWNEP